MTGVQTCALPICFPVTIEVEWSNQSAKTIEEQISYPLISNLMSLPKIETIRAMSSFSTSMIYVIFKDGVDLYDARSRILEQLSTLQGTFPALAKENGEFTPKKIEAKRVSSDKYEILSGLTLDDEVINNSLFLYDADAMTNRLYDETSSIVTGKQIGRAHV